ncbi:hypothetical protein ACWF95_37805 [Streptomyces vinaceus]
MHRQVRTHEGLLIDPNHHGQAADLLPPTYSSAAPSPAAEYAHWPFQLQQEAAVAALTVSAEEWTHEPAPATTGPTDSFQENATDTPPLWLA